MQSYCIGIENREDEHVLDYNNNLNYYTRCDMKGDFGSLVWVNDKEGHEYVCTITNNNDENKNYESLSESERATCLNTNDFIGTDRW